MGIRSSYYMCDGDHRGHFCLIDAEKVDRMGMVRCVRHGAILNMSPAFQGMTRKEARAVIAEETEREKSRGRFGGLTRE